MNGVDKGLNLYSYALDDDDEDDEDNVKGGSNEADE